MLTALLLSLLATAPTPQAGEPEPDGVVATAPATPVALDGGPAAPVIGGAPQAAAPHGLDTDEQIARWLAARSAETGARDESPIWRDADDRKLHGEFNVGFGTGGYRDYGAAVSLPIGENGRLDLSVRQVENGYPHPYGYGYRPGFDPYFDASGYAFPGRSEPGAALDYERRVSRPDGPPWIRPQPRPQQAADE